MKNQSAIYFAIHWTGVYSNRSIDQQKSKDLYSPLFVFCFLSLSVFLIWSIMWATLFFFIYLLNWMNHDLSEFVVLVLFVEKILIQWNNRIKSLSPSLIDFSRRRRIVWILYYHRHMDRSHRRRLRLVQCDLILTPQSFIDHLQFTIQLGNAYQRFDAGRVFFFGVTFETGLTIF